MVGSVLAVVVGEDRVQPPFAAQQADRWKSVMSNVGLVVDLGPIKRLMTIKGNWNANNGAEAEYGGSQTNPDFPSPQIEFAPELQPVIDVAPDARIVVRQRYTRDAQIKAYEKLYTECLAA